MENNELNESEVIGKLVNLNTYRLGKGSCVAWATFPYNKTNLKVVEDSLKKLNWNEEDYSLNHDENLIFVTRDL
ncbi:hypothetical protein [Methanobacterium oryzae]|uniref:hypothetical protein n=1 Tax=Methanobacterium oryzae TaxID=69540 RepID=UPI003D1E6CDF